MNQDEKAKSLGAVLRVDVNDGRVGYFKKPDRITQGLFLAQLGQNQIRAMEIILQNTLIKEVSTINLQDDGDFFTCIDHAGKLIEAIEKKSSTSTLL